MRKRWAASLDDFRDRYYATDRQRWFLRKLLHDAFARGIVHGLCLDPNHLPDRLSRSDASAAIDTLKRLLAAMEVECVTQNSSR